MNHHEFVGLLESHSKEFLSMKNGDFSDFAFGNHNVNIFHTIGSTITNAMAFFSDIKEFDLNEKQAMKHFGIERTTVFRAFKGFNRLVLSYDSLVCYIIYHLKLKGVSKEEIDTIVSLLRKYI